MLASLALASTREALVVGCLYLAALLAVRTFAPHRVREPSRPPVALQNFAAFTLAYAAALAALAYIKSPVHDALLSVAGIVVGVRLMDLL